MIMKKTYENIGDRATSVLGAVPVGGLDIEAKNASGVVVEHPG